MTWCQFFEPTGLPASTGWEYGQEVHEVECTERPFFIPLPEGNAVQVNVCHDHARRLYDLFPQIERSA